MSGINHVVGGIVFTGIFSSFWNINIFSKIEYIGLCSFFSVLPDIDHTRSPIGKLFYPIANYLDRHFGHRTITHSFLALILLTFLISTLEKLYGNNFNLTLLFAFSYGSHLIFDMMTIEGVLLFYPFRRNPCVIPGNPAMRLKSGDFNTEAILMVLFLLTGTTCKPLFEQGFWTSLNRSLGTLRHLHNEFIASDKLIELTYDCSHLGQHYAGKGYLVNTTPQQAIVFQDTVFLEINREFKINTLLPTKTEQDYKTEELLIHNAPLEELPELLRNKPIIDLHLQSNVPINFFQGKKPLTSTQVDLAYTYNPQLQLATDHEQKALQQALRRKLLFEKKQRSISHRIAHITDTVNQMDHYTREKATQELQYLKKHLKTLTENAIEQETELPNKPNSNPLCSGYIHYLVLDAQTP